MTLLYLVRHGQTEWSRSGQHTSITDLDLTEDGVEQAISLRTRLDPADFGLVLTSPRLRAQRTAELAGFDDYEVDEDLAEWYYGDFEGLTSA
jgi:probable phosphoglycerate mutase